MSEADKITIGTVTDLGPVGLDIARVFGSRLLIQGDSGSGKSVMVRRIAESTMGMLPWFIIDPEGEYATLREAGDVLVLGGDHGDAPLLVPTAEMYAKQLRASGVNVVLDLSEMDSTTEQRQWVRAFVDALVAVKSGPRALVFVDECHEFAPEAGKGESCATESVARLMKRGRKRGLAGVVVTQRLSSLSKEVGSLCTSVLIGTTAPLDAPRACDLMGLPRSKKTMFIDLPTHQWVGRGQAIAKQPVEFSTKFPKTREPDPESTESRPATSASLAKLAKALGKIKPPKEEKAEQVAATKAIADERLIQDAINERDKYWTAQYARLLHHLSGHMKALRLARNALGACFDDAKTVLGWKEGDANAMVAGEAAPPPTESVNKQPQNIPNPITQADLPTAPPPADFTVNGTQQRILDAIAWWESIGVTDPGNARIGIIVGIDSTGGYFSNTVGPLSTHGLVKRERGSTTLTPQGRSLARRQPKAPTMQAYLDAIRSRFSGRTLDMLNAIIATGNSEQTTQEIGEAVGIDHTGGYFSNTIGPLSSFGLIQRSRGNVKPTALLFPGGLR